MFFFLFYHFQQNFSIEILYFDVGVKSLQLWCLRIVPCVALPQSFLRSAPVGAKHVPLAHSTPVFAYRGIIIPLLCSYRGGSQGLSSTYEQAHVDLDLLTLASCLNYHLLFCYVYTILCISRIFCCICNFFHQNAASVRKLASNHGTESISSFCANVQYLKCIKDAGRQKGRSSVTILSNVQNE